MTQKSAELSKENTRQFIELMQKGKPNTFIMTQSLMLLKDINHHALGRELLCELYGVLTSVKANKKALTTAQNKKLDNILSQTANVLVDTFKIGPDTINGPELNWHTERER